MFCTLNLLFIKSAITDNKLLLLNLANNKNGVISGHIYIANGDT
ncbi:hypothetical protein [Campylobacter gastrosuis]|uniref:Uncharacterized protein n=1 Tax=Campylobacter gastrosuis TaxID=2974576 RepID=A0ABT7HQN2_9BACT|nr:hypothetical protein [Campylobacter gastrosuis]MDL0089173.1 hypothetical protein [Campylobacter gastrosuis]